MKHTAEREDAQDAQEDEEDGGSGCGDGSSGKAKKAATNVKDAVRRALEARGLGLRNGQRMSSFDSPQISAMHAWLKELLADEFRRDKPGRSEQKCRRAEVMLLDSHRPPLFEMFADAVIVNHEVTLALLG